VVNNLFEKTVEKIVLIIFNAETIWPINFFVSTMSTTKFGEKPENRTFRPWTCRCKVRQYFDVL